MQLSELKALHVSALLEMAAGLEIDNANRMRKQELMFAILKKRAKSGEPIFGDGTLEVLPTGSASCARPRRRTWPAPTTSTSRRRRSAASRCTRATRSRVRSGRRRTASAISRW